MDLAGTLGIESEDLVLTHVEPDGLVASLEAIVPTSRIQAMAKSLESLSSAIDDLGGIELGSAVAVGTTPWVGREASSACYLWPERGAISLLVPLQQKGGKPPIRPLESQGIPAWGGRLMSNMALKSSKKAEMLSLMSDGLDASEAGEVLYHQIATLEDEALGATRLGLEGSNQVEEYCLRLREDDFMSMHGQGFAPLLAHVEGRHEASLLAKPFTQWKTCRQVTKAVEADRASRSKNEEYVMFYEEQLVQALDEQASILINYYHIWTVFLN